MFECTLNITILLIAKLLMNIVKHTIPTALGDRSKLG